MRQPNDFEDFLYKFADKTNNSLTIVDKINNLYNLLLKLRSNKSM